jgi:hypothetical protein
VGRAPRRRFGARVALAFAATLATSASIAANAHAYVYFTTGDNGAGSGPIVRANLDGSINNASFIADDGTGISAVAVDGNYIYWTSDYSGVGPAISRANLDGTGIIQKFIALPGAFRYGLAVDGSYIYWSNYQGIGRAPISGGTPDETWLPIGPGVAGVAVDSQSIYWVDLPTNEIGRANLNGSSPTLLINLNLFPGSHANYGLAVDGSYIYWSEQSGPSGVVGRALKADGSGVNQSFVSEPTEPGAASAGLAVDGAHVYWISFSGTASALGIGRANIDGSSPTPNFLTGAWTGTPFGIAVDGLSSTAPPPTTPTVTSINPHAGSISGGTSVVISGTDLTGATAVKFGAKPAVHFTVNSDTQITATAPSSTTPSSVDVTVTTPSGTSPVSAADRFTYDACVVPKLKGKTLKQAKKTLKKADCHLGKVSGQTKGALVKQHPKPGKILPPGSKVDIKLG